jgi:hypothetical protein
VHHAARLFAKVVHARRVAMVGTPQTLGSAFRRTRLPRAAPLVVVALTLAFALTMAPGCARQVDKIPRIGFLSSGPSVISDGFGKGLKELGLVEGSTIIIERRWTEAPRPVD